MLFVRILGVVLFFACVGWGHQCKTSGKTVEAATEQECYSLCREDVHTHNLQPEQCRFDGEAFLGLCVCDAGDLIRAELYTPQAGCPPSDPQFFQFEFNAGDTEQSHCVWRAPFETKDEL